MFNIPHLSDKTIQLGGENYSLADIALMDLDINIRKNIIDEAEITYELFLHLLTVNPPIEDEIIIHLAKKVGNGDAQFKIPYREAGCKLETPLELAVLKQRSDEVLLALAEKQPQAQREAFLTRLLRRIIGLFFPSRRLDMLEKKAMDAVGAKKIKIEINDRIDQHTEAIHEEQPATSMVIKKRRQS